MPVLPIDTYRGLKIISPLGDELQLRSFNGTDSLGRLFSYELDLLSTNPNIQFEDIVGQRVTVSLELKDGERFFDGFITTFRFTEGDSQFSSYRATVRPWFWFLTRTTDCRIFQNQKVPDIIKSVFRDNGMPDFKDRLSGTYPDWDYCVQYRESDFNFISRLMEQEGIYYYFEHVMGKHFLVLADSLAAHDPYPGYETVPYFPPDAKVLRARDHLQHWSVSQTIQPGKYVLTDYDFEKPKVDLRTKVSHPRPHAYPIAKHELFDYPGEYKDFDQGDFYVDLKMQEIQARHETVKAGGTARGMNAGYLFTLDKHPREDQNGKYLITAVKHRIRSDDFETKKSLKPEDVYRCKIEVLNSAQPFRSERLTSKPSVKGPQTAVVVGPDDEEIYCDEYGRVKVQFHWDRYGKNDQNSSCWVRVSQAWAGKGWGSIHTPRIGHEVLVGFLEGDPDQPVITGRVYNANRMPPYELAKNKTQSGIKSRSSEGGEPDNFNEIRMEDKKDSEELYIQAEKDENILVKNDKGETIGHDETISVGNDRQESVGHDETLNIGNDRSVSVGANQNIKVGACETEEIIGNMTVTVGGNSSLSVSGNETASVGGGQNLDVGGQQVINVGSTADLSIGATYNISAGAPITITSGSMITLMAGGSKIEIGPQGITIQTGAIVNVLGSLVKIN